MHTQTMRTLGMIVRAIWPDGDVPGQIFDVVVARPATGLALLNQYVGTLEADDPRHNEIAALIGRLGNDLSDPAGGVRVEDQGPFWLGYYHYATAREHSATIGPAGLERIGEALYGPRWQTDLARDLELSDARRVRQWIAGERPIPPGVWADLSSLVKQRRMTLAAVLGDIDS